MGKSNKISDRLLLLKIALWHLQMMILSLKWMISERIAQKKTIYKLSDDLGTVVDSEEFKKL